MLFNGGGGLVCPPLRLLCFRYQSRSIWGIVFTYSGVKQSNSYPFVVRFSCIRTAIAAGIATGALSTTSSISPTSKAPHRETKEARGT